jgi:hypothetical protein
MQFKVEVQLLTLSLLLVVVLGRALLGHRPVEMEAQVVVAEMVVLEEVEIPQVLHLHKEVMEEPA